MKKLFQTILLGLMIPVIALTVNIQSASAVAHTITGTVRNPTNGYVSGAFVYATNPSSDVIEYGPVLTNGSGVYSLPIGVAGTYDIHFVPPANQTWPKLIDSSTAVSSNLTINKSFALTTQTYNLSGTVRDGSGNPIQNSTIKLGVNQVGTDVNGFYSITVPANNYALSVIGGNIPGIDSFTLTQPTAGINLSSGNQTLDLTIKTAQITVTPRTNSGIIPYATVTARATSGSTKLYPGDPGTNITLAYSNQVTATNAPATLTTIQGAIYLAGGMEATSSAKLTSICSTIGGTTTYFDCLRLPLTVTGNVNIETPSLTPTVRTFSGTLTDSNNAPIPNARIVLFKYGDQSTTTYTDANGNFSMNAMPKKYSLKVQDIGAAIGVYSLALTQSATNPTIDMSTDDVTLNLQIPTATMTVSAYDSFGYPAYNAEVGTQTNSGTAYLYSGDPGFSISVVHNSATTPSNSNVVTFNTITGAVYAAKGANQASPTDSVCVKVFYYSNWNCLTSARTITGTTAFNVPQ